VSVCHEICFNGNETNPAYPDGHIPARDRVQFNPGSSGCFHCRYPNHPPPHVTSLKVITSITHQTAPATGAAIAGGNGPHRPRRVQGSGPDHLPCFLSLDMSGMEQVVKAFAMHLVPSGALVDTSGRRWGLRGMARANAGNCMAARTAIIAMATSNSINVNAADRTTDARSRSVRCASA